MGITANKAVDDDSDTGSEDSDYVPPEDWKKTISVGSDFQAVVPEGLSPYDDAPGEYTIVAPHIERYFLSAPTYSWFSNCSKPINNQYLKMVILIQL